jgi:cytochrome c biogenesis protein CcdA
LTPVEFLTVQVEQAGMLAPLIGALVGVALTLTPISWPSVPAVVALVGPARAAAREGRPAAVSGRRGFAVVLGFVFGMDGVIAGLSAAFLGILVLLTRGAVVLTVVAIVVLSYAAVRLLLAPGPAVCRRLDSLPPEPMHAVWAGVAFSVSGCPGCAPIAAAVGAAAAAAGPLVSLLVVASFVLGRAATLYAAAATGGRWLTPNDPRRARRLDMPWPLSSCSQPPTTPTGLWTARCAPRSQAKGSCCPEIWAVVQPRSGRDGHQTPLAFSR